MRLVGQGLAARRPRQGRRPSPSFAVAAVAGLVLVALTGQWWLLAVGAASIAAAWLYTGGPRPYGYAGLGEVFVFVFFGLVPVVGTAYVQTLTITAADVVASIGVGLLACAILVTNNLRDIAGDTVAGKITLAVRLGDRPHPPALSPRSSSSPSSCRSRSPPSRRRGWPWRVPDRRARRPARSGSSSAVPWVPPSSRP